MKCIAFHFTHHHVTWTPCKMIKIRNFSLADLKRVLKIENASFPEPYSKRYFLELYKKFPDEFLVAENKTDLAGYIIGRLKGNSGEIISLAVDSDYRRKGVGTKLYHSLIKYFKKLKIKNVFLHVRTGNRPAISFYKKLSFETLKKIPNYYRNNEDAYLMKKILGG